MITKYPIKLFSNKELAQRFGINLARWKRWVRDFLPPDPLAGRQSGYARQFYLNDAFQVFLAGVLVGDLHFSVSEARAVLSDLGPRLTDIGYRLDPRGSALPNPVRYRLEIRKDAAGKLSCRLKGGGVTAGGFVDFGSGDADDSVARLGSRCIDLTACLERFLDCVDPDRIYFRELYESLPKTVAPDPGV